MQYPAEKTPDRTPYEIHGNKSHENHDDFTEHPDERWLVSYADMMTLLFGLFVMLYSISHVDKKKFDVVRKTATKQFGGQYLSQEEIDSKKTNLPPVPSSLPVTAPVTVPPTEVIEKKKEETSLPDHSRELEIKKTTLLHEADLKTHKADLKKIDSLEKTVADLNKQIDQLKNSTTPPISNFMSVIMSWPTVDHDIDLSITDPNGKVFDFKHRKFKEHPGAFVTDSRRGPGTEVWQSEKIIPGKYTIRYSFYNQYGNSAPTTVIGALVTPKGSFDLPKVTLDFETNPSFTIILMMDENGQFKLEP